MRNLIVVFAIVLLTTVPARAQQSYCADCHFAHPESPGQRHLSEWDRSAHGRRLVGCESCHGGNPRTTESLPAHMGILGPSDAAGPTNPVNIPRTCGRCHTGPFVQFQKSRHYELVRGGNPDAPGCATCHGEVAADLLSPRGLEQQCVRCHGQGKRQQRLDYPPLGRSMMESVGEVRDALKTARRLVDRVQDRGTKQRFQEAYRQAEVPLVQAVENAHAFVYDQMQERIGVAHERASALLDALANPKR